MLPCLKQNRLKSNTHTHWLIWVCSTETSTVVSQTNSLNRIKCSSPNTHHLMVMRNNLFNSDSQPADVGGGRKLGRVQWGWRTLTTCRDTTQEVKMSAHCRENVSVSSACYICLFDLSGQTVSNQQSEFSQLQGEGVVAHFLPHRRNENSSVTNRFAPVLLLHWGNNRRCVCAHVCVWVCLCVPCGSVIWIKHE